MDELATTGPYAIVRNPLYLGSLTAAGGLIFACTSLSLSLSKPYLDRSLFYWGCLWILVDSIYLPKIAKEEENLRGKFGAAFDAYADRVPSMFPKTLHFRDFKFETFHLDQWKKNKEYGSLIGYFFLCLLLIARYLYRR